MSRIDIPARPEALSIDPARTAVIVIDMQHAYLSKGGYLDLVGFGVDGAEPVVANCVRLIDSARAAKIPVFFIRNGFDADLTEAGPETSPVWHKSNPLKFMRANPDHKGQLITKGAWDYEFHPDIKPLPGEPVIHKSRYSAFCSTQLEAQLRGRGITHLIVIGVNTNVCVESTIRDGFHKEFFCMIAADATMQAGDASIFNATLYNIEKFLGWVSSTDEVCDALGKAVSA